ncbi:MAG: DNA repair exonuclease [Acidobacteria bacterium]|nr:DNA repair exonuclease [Acidobacteriota bacterium]
MFKFLHAADIHLDSALRGIARYEGMPVDDIRLATRRAFDNLVRLAIGERVRFVLLAGDLYDGDWKDTSTGMFFAARMTRLREAGIPVFLAAGNHDAANRMTKSLRLPENVRVFSGKNPESVELPGGDVVIHGQSFSNQQVFQNLAADYPAKRPGCFNIGLLHTSVSGFEGHEPYAPCTLDDLRLKEYDFWALGHIHARQELCSRPRVLFPGNIQGRNIRETGPKGCTLVSVGDGCEILDSAHIALDVIRWERASVDLAGAETTGELQDRASNAIRTAMAAADDRPLVLRIEFQGATPLHDRLVAEDQWRDDLRALAADIGAELVWIEKIVLRTCSPTRSTPLSGPLAEVRQYVQSLAARSGEIASVADSVAPLLAKLPDDLKQELKTWLEPGGERYRRLVEDAESLLMERLRGQGGAQ